MTDRIDFIETAAGIVVQKYQKQPYKDRMNTSEIKPADFDLQAALDWCQANGYTVRTWSNGARAWKGTIWPIRTTREIIRKRRELEQIVRAKMRQDPGKWHSEETTLQLDLAYDG